jgi:signal transduction histidine kinase
MGDMRILFPVLWRVFTRLLRYLRRGIFLVPVAAIAIALFGVQPWTLATVVLALFVAFWRPVIAAALLPVAMAVAGISGLVVAATQPGTSFWSVSALQMFRGRLTRVPPHRPPVTAIVERAIGRGHQVMINRFGAAPVTPGAARAAAGAWVRRGTQVHAFTRVRAGTRVTWSAPRFIRDVAIPAGPGARLQVTRPIAQSWQAMASHGQVAWHAGPGGSLWPGGLLVPLALLLLTLGLWLLPRSASALRTHTAGLLSSVRQRMLENRWGILLIPVALLGLTVFGVHLWTVAAVLVSIVTAARWPLIAADLVPVALTAFAVRGFMIAASWPSLPGLERAAELYGFFVVTTRQTAMLAGAEASAFLVVAAWLVPWTIGAHARAMLVPGRALELEGRVQRLTETRDLAVDAAATELRRIERDLHDGAQGRLVALGMNLRAVERMLPGRPEAALALVAEARETSLRALNDLRDLVRGICPPVLADRGLGHAVRALALDTPFPVDLDIDLPGRLTAPVESACYFAVAEALANAVRHSGARRVHIRMQHTDGVLRVQVADDGAGGADPARGSGLRGVEQRLAAFDGILAVSSPPGGPTMIAMEVPCALSSPKTCSC